MDKIIRYTKTGHHFEIEGCMDVGYTIHVKVFPKDGYHFVQWLNGDPNITPPTDEALSENAQNPEFDIYIDECGFSFAALFEAGSAPTPPPPVHNEYTVSWNTGAGFTVSTTADNATINNGAVVEPGKSVTITVKAASGYNLNTCTLNGVSATFTPTSSNTVRTATFTMPSANVMASITATAQPVELPTYYYLTTTASSAPAFSTTLFTSTQSNTITLGPNVLQRDTVVVVPQGKTVSGTRYVGGNFGIDMVFNILPNFSNLPSGYVAYYYSTRSGTAEVDTTSTIIRIS